MTGATFELTVTSQITGAGSTFLLTLPLTVARKMSTVQLMTLPLVSPEP